MSFCAEIQMKLEVDLEAHLCPLPQHITPILPDFSSSLSLHPLPDLLVTADRFETFNEKVTGSDTIVSNPGSFARSNYTFHVYYPSQNRIEASQIPTGETAD
ncbi:hypothetical protein CRE_30262 [Caenorhabditis remanei]|uniref:Uncharacterized protein n=1 Tax=Caenorhabditis remanei TaxID=31234 RepID=E3NMR3_CAERE|nr:hypothetical protein CRE_30262 [Caenorhabditis remanei]